MRVVPLNRLFIQPNVQYRWLLQHGSIEFVVDKRLLSDFQRVWADLTLSNLALQDYLMTPSGLSECLHEHDRLFGLVLGADYARQHSEHFRAYTDTLRVHWSLSSCLLLTF